MTRRLARRLRAPFAAALSAVLVLLSPGLEAPRLFAQTFHAAPVEAVSAVAGPSAPAVSLSAPSLAPALGSARLSAAAVPSAPLALAAPSAAAPALPGVAAALAPQLAAAAAPSLSATGAYGAGRGIEDALTGARSAGSGDVAVAAPALAAAEGLPASALTAAANEAKPAAPSAVDSAAAPAPAAAKSVDSAASYKIHRLLLRMVAALTGAVDSLPPAGPALTDALIAQAADRRAVISDYDDTLAAYNERLPADMVEAVRAIHAAGKTFDVISDRGDEKRGSTLTVFESLDTLPVETRAGMYVAANSGGRVYRYDEAGTPVKVYEAPAMSDAVKGDIAAAAEATKARLAEAGTVMHDGVGKVPSESWGPYSYALMLKPGSSEDSVRATAAILQAELDKRGVEVEVNPRFAKDPANPPYVTLSLITKEGAARYIAGARKAGSDDVVILGDSMYVPHAPKKDSWLTRLGERASGQVRPTLGNRTDANMERGVPGALTLSVGTTGDPRPPHLYVLAGKGPSVTRRVLTSVASKPAGTPRAGAKAETVLHVAGALAIIATVAGAYSLFIHSIAELVGGWEGGIHQFMQGGGDLLFGMAGTLGFGYGYGASRFVVNPAEDYSAARDKAVAIAAARGASAGDVLFVEATAALPAHESEHWKYQFEIPGKAAGTRALVYVDSSRFLGGPVDLRASIYEGARAPDGRMASSVYPVHFAMGAKVAPQGALDALRAQAPSFGASASVVLDYREEPGSGDKDLWYRFYDSKGGVASVNARTAEIRLEAGVKPAPSLSASISPASPIDGFTTFVYDTGLAAAKELAAKAGYAPDNLRLEGAKLSPRAWGEDWTFEFVSPREGYLRDPRSYAVTVRRTMVSETQVDAIDAKDEGPRRGPFAVVAAAALPELVKLSPLEAIARTGPDARALELQARWPAGEGPTQLWYVVRGEKGRELKAINAATGVETVPAPYAWMAPFLTWLAGIGLVVLIYGGGWYAMSHAPAAQPPAVEQGQYVPDVGIDQLFGR